jgi:phage/plasmid primase-like uncharacterized protein
MEKCMMQERDSIRAALAYIPAHDRDLWVRMGMAIKSALGEDGFGLWDQWSQQDESYNERDARNAWRSIKANGRVTIGTLYHEAQQRGFRSDGESRAQSSTDAEIAARERQRRATEAEEQRRHAEAAAKARAIWNAAQPAPDDHPYLLRKGIPAHGLRLYRGDLVIRDMPCDGALIVPAYGTDRQMHTLEFIHSRERDNKRFLASGEKQGHFFALSRHKIKDGEDIVIGEGYATLASVFEATGLTCFVAFDSDNLLEVAQRVHELFPKGKIILAADNDVHADGKRNTGIDEARKAALAVGGLLAVPEMDGAKCDFNDLHRQRGADAVKAAIANAKQPETAEPKEGNAREIHEWPQPLDDAAFYGLAGEIARTIEPHSEADPAAILLQLLAAFGSMIGRGPHYLVEGDQHHAVLNLVLVGETGKGRKGTSLGRVRQVCRLVDPIWEIERVVSGLSSGEGLIWQVRDPIVKKVKGKEETIDEGVQDKRLLVVESEFARVLRVIRRDGNILSAVVRDAWDRGALRTLTKNTPAVATNAHISIVGHITADELRAELTQTDVGNGFVNRFLLACVRRARLLPFGGNLQVQALSTVVEKLKGSVVKAKAIRRVTMDNAACKMWEAVYPALSEGQPGLYGAATGRAEAQTVRLALIYALLDGAAAISAEHLHAALAVWEYCAESACFIFGSALGDPVADEILRALRAAHPNGMTKTDISGLFRRHQATERIGAALELLDRRGFAQKSRNATGGRPTETWHAIFSVPMAKKEN